MRFEEAEEEGNDTQIVERLLSEVQCVSQVMLKWAKCGLRRRRELSRESRQVIVEVYKYFVYRLHSSQVTNIPYQLIRSQEGDPKWMTNLIY